MYNVYQLINKVQEKFKCVLYRIKYMVDWIFKKNHSIEQIPSVRKKHFIQNQRNVLVVLVGQKSISISKINNREYITSRSKQTFRRKLLLDNLNLNNYFNLGVFFNNFRNNNKFQDITLLVKYTKNITNFDSSYINLIFPENWLFQNSIYLKSKNQLLQIRSFLKTKTFKKYLLLFFKCHDF